MGLQLGRKRKKPLALKVVKGLLWAMGPWAEQMEDTSVLRKWPSFLQRTQLPLNP